MIKWISFFGDFDGRISRRTFWLTGIVVFIIQILIAVAAAVAAEAIANEAAGDMAMDIVLFVFLYPQFVISVKRGHDRNISTWMIGVAYILLALFDVLRFAGWLRTHPKSKHVVGGKSDFIRVYRDRRSRQPGSADRTWLSPWYAGPESLRPRPAR